MAFQNVQFYFGSQARYDALVEKDSLALYFIEDTQRLYKGNVLLGAGAEVTEKAAGLLSAEDYAQLKKLIEAGPTAALKPVDGTISIVDNKIGVKVSKTEGNLVSVKDDGLFAAVESLSLDKIIGLEERLSNIESAAIGGVHYRGSVPTEADLPKNAAQGDLYEVLEDNSEWCFNGEKWFKYGYTIDYSLVAGTGIAIDGRKVSVKIAPDSHGLTAVDGGMTMLLATAEQDGAMSKKDKAFIDSIPGTYATIDRLKKIALLNKFEISSKPEGTIVNYGEKEIRVMCPANTKWVKQTVGNGGNANMYYMGFKAYAPDGAVSFKEGDRGVIVDEMFTFDSAFAGTDEFGRNYSICWLALASYDATSDTWTYFGKNSSVERYIGWDYIVEWYDANGVMISTDNIRINLSNEDCHNNAIPYYMNSYATVEQINALEENVTEMYSWSEL